MPWTIRNVVFVSLIMLPVIIYMWLSGSNALSRTLPLSRRQLGLVFTLIVLWFYALPVIYYGSYLSGNLNSLFVFNTKPVWQDVVFHYPFWIGVIVIMEVLPVYLLSDLGAGISKILYKQPRWTNGLAWVKTGWLLGMIVFVPIQAWYHTNVVRLNTQEIELPGRAEALSGLKIGLLADLQLDRYTGNNKMQQVRDLLEETPADVLMFAGDLVTSGTDFIPAGLQSMQDDSTQQKIAVLGDHDFWADPQSIAQGLNERGWRFLDNRHYVFQHNGKRVLVTGVTHIYSRRIKPDSLTDLLKTAPDADYRILLVHQPAQFIVEEAARQGYDLFMAGHTHGGQVVFHPLGIELTPSRFETRFYSGIFTEGDMRVAVSNGVGLTLAPLRYGAPAEVMLLQLK